MKLLLNKSADVNAQGEEYRVVLQAALENGHEQIIKLLLDKSADIKDSSSREYRNALYIALESGYE
jgi:ankyrin repeat protein